MNYDQWLDAPYIEQGLREAQMEIDAERIYNSYDRKVLFPEFLTWYG